MSSTFETVASSIPSVPGEVLDGKSKSNTPDVTGVVAQTGLDVFNHHAHRRCRSPT
ncbi:MAG: hypothetical protein WA594_12535 [Candidatus Sulfotelmatobacter sp.]